MGYNSSLDYTIHGFSVSHTQPNSGKQTIAAKTFYSNQRSSQLNLVLTKITGGLYVDYV